MNDRFDPNSTDSSMASLVGDIITDAQNLIKQQFALLTRELQLEVRHAKRAAISLGVGAVIAGVGAILILVMLVNVLNVYAEVPLWGCYGIVGGSTAALGCGLLLFGKKEASEVAVAPPPQTAETIKENLQWLKRQTTSNAS